MTVQADTTTKTVDPATGQETVRTITVFEAVQRVKAGIGAIPASETAPKVAGGYKFRSYGTILDTVRVMTTRYGLTIAPMGPHGLEINSISTSNGKQFHGHGRFVFQVYGPAGDSFETAVLAAGVNGRDKWAGTVNTYAHRMMLCQLFEIPFKDDDDGQPERTDDGMEMTGALNAAQLKAVYNALEGVPEEWRDACMVPVLEHNGVDSIDAIPGAQTNRVLAHIGRYEPPTVSDGEQGPGTPETAQEGSTAGIQADEARRELDEWHASLQGDALAGFEAALRDSDLWPLDKITADRLPEAHSIAAGIVQGGRR